MSINLDSYYRGLAAQQIQQLGDQLLQLSQQAESAEAHDAAWHLADLSTQLLDLGVSVGTALTPQGRDEPL